MGKCTFNFGSLAIVAIGILLSCSNCSGITPQPRKKIQMMEITEEMIEKARTEGFSFLSNKLEDLKNGVAERNINEKKDTNGATALHEAASLSDEKPLQILLKHGAAKNAKDNSGATPLHAAAKNGRMWTTLMLLESARRKIRKTTRVPLRYTKLLKMAM